MDSPTKFQGICTSNGQVYSLDSLIQKQIRAAIMCQGLRECSGQDQITGDITL